MLKSRHIDDSLKEVGIDEAGRGCLWGPLVAAAVSIPPESSWSDEDRIKWGMIKDSKQLSPKKRALLQAFIKEKAAFGIGYVEASEIDTFGMTRSNQLAFQRAYDSIGIDTCRVIIDGILGMPDLNKDIEQVVCVEADGLYLAVAAASIVAKETRDTWVLHECAKDDSLDTKYGLKSSKGYGTAKHRAGVTTHGMHSQHRRLFLRKLLGNDICKITDE